MSKCEPFYIGIGPPTLISDAFELFFKAGELEAYRRLAPFLSEEDEKKKGRADQKLLERFQNLDYHVNCCGWPTDKEDVNPISINCIDIVHVEFSQNRIRTNDGTCYNSCLLFADDEHAVNFFGDIWMYGARPLFFWHSNPPSWMYERVLSRPKEKGKAGRPSGPPRPHMRDALERAAVLYIKEKVKTKKLAAEMAAKEFDLDGYVDQLAEYMQPSKIPAWATPLTREMLGAPKDEVIR